MSYNDREISSFSAQPVEIYEFQYGLNTVRLTSHDEDIIIDLKTYYSVPISRKKFEITQDVNRIPLIIKMSREVDFTDTFMASPPSSEVIVTIYRFHLGEPQNRIVYWFGRLVNIKYSEIEVEFRCESIHSSIKRPALRRFYQPNCPHVLYSEGEGNCQVNILNFEFSSVVETINGTTINFVDLSGKENGYYTGGFIKYRAGDFDHLCFIDSHTANSIVLSLPPSDLIVGDNVKLYPGCDHTDETCLQKFNNLDNYGGFPYHPEKNPFGASQIF